MAIDLRIVGSGDHEPVAVEPVEMRSAPTVGEAPSQVRAVPMEGQRGGVAVRCGPGQPEDLAAVPAEQRVVEILDPLGWHLGHQRANVGNGNQKPGLAGFEIDKKKTVVLGELDSPAGVLPIAAVTVIGPRDAQPCEVDADGFLAVGRNGADGVVDHLQFPLRVDVHDDGDKSPVAEVIVDDL